MAPKSVFSLGDALLPVRSRFEVRLDAAKVASDVGCDLGGMTGVASSARVVSTVALKVNFVFRCHVSLLDVESRFLDVLDEDVSGVPLTDADLVDVLDAVRA